MRPNIKPQDGLPQSWETRPLGEVVKPSRPRIKPLEKPDLPFIGMEHIEAHTMKLLGTVPAGTMKSSAVHFQPGDVLYGRLRPYLNKVYRPNFEGLCSAEFIVFPKTEGVDSRYLQYFLNSSTFASFASHLNTGDRPRVDFDQLAPYTFPVAPPEQQQSIVAEIEKQFSRLDEAVANLKRYKAAVEGKLTEDWRKAHPDVEPASELLERIRTERRSKWKGRRKYKEPLQPDTSILPKLPARWTWTNVDQLAEVGTGATPRRGKSQYYTGGHIPWVTSSALNRTFVDKANEFVTDTALQETNLTLYPPGTLLLAMYGEGRTRGKCSQLHIHATTNQAIAAIQCIGEIREYLKLAIWNQYADLRRTASGGVQPNLNLSLVRSITIPFPPLIEQQWIVNEIECRLSVIEELETTVEANLTRANRLRQSILGKAFSGQLLKPTAHSPQKVA